MAQNGLTSDAEAAASVVEALAGVGIARPQAIYLFGSTGRGADRPDSDIDLAFLADRRQDPVAVFDAAQTLATALGRDVDLVDLRAASTVLRLQVVAYGRRLWADDPVAADTFEMYTFSDYARLQEERAEAVRAFDARYDD